MDRRCTSSLIGLAVVALATGAAAQTDTGTRAGAARAARAEKAAAPSGPGPGRLERVLTALETGGGVQRWLGPRDGLVVRLGGIEDGPGTAIGPAWRESDALAGRVQLSGSGAVSMGRDTDVDVTVALPRVGTSRLTFRVDGSASTLAQERFFGEGPDSRREHEAAFRLSRRRLQAVAGFTAAKWLHVSAGAGLLHASAGRSASARVPPVAAVFTPGDATGLDARPHFTTLSLAGAIDYRDIKQNPRAGGRYAIAVHRYQDRTARRHSFTRVDLELEQHLSAWRRQRVLTLRAIASSSRAAEGHDVPFYLQRTLGGSRSLRGFVADRFRDRQLLLLQAEYGWDLMPFLSAVLFVEQGAVAQEWRDFTMDGLRRDYGLGLRFGSARTVALRTDVTFGSGEGTRFTMRFGHAF